MTDEITITNVSPQGSLDVPLLHRVVAAGETVTVTATQAHALLAQSAWKAVSKPAEKIATAAKRKARAGRPIALAAPKPPTTSPANADGSAPAGSQDKE